MTAQDGGDAAAAATLPYASWSQRAVAITIDGVLLLLVSGGVALVLRQPLRLPRSAGDVLLSVLVSTAYYGGLNGSRSGQTLGKRTVRIQVRNAEAGGPIGIPRGAARHLVEWVLGWLVLPAILDGLWPLWDRRHQSLHDKVVRSVVVDLNPPATPVPPAPGADERPSFWTS